MDDIWIHEVYILLVLFPMNFKPKEKKHRGNQHYSSWHYSLTNMCPHIIPLTTLQENIH